MQCLTSATQALASLEELLGSSLGPLGADKVVVTETKQSLVTSAGEAILAVLAPENPIVSLVVRAARDIGARHGDGSKRLVLMLAAGLRQAVREASLESGQPRMNHLVHSLGALQAGSTGLLSQSVADRLSLWVALQRGNMSRASRQVLGAVLSTASANKVGSTAVKHLSRLLTDLVCAHLTLHKDQPAREVLQGLCRSPPIVWAPGAAVTSSRLQPGVLLRQGLASRHMAGLITGVSFVVLSCSLEDSEVHGVASAAVLVSSGAQYKTRVLDAREQAVRQRLAALQDRGVGLILCAGRASEVVVSVCLELSLALACSVEQDELDCLCAAAGIQACSSAVPAALLQADVGWAEECREFALGRQHVLALELTQAHVSLLLHAPSDGLCRQYLQHLMRGLALVAALVGEPPPDAVVAQTAAGVARAQVPEHLCIVPGGGAFDAALAEQLAQRCDLSKHGGDLAFSQAQPALRVLHAMASALPLALARSCPQSAPRPGGVATAASTSSAAGILELVHMLRQQHKAAGQLGRPCAAGLVLPLGACNPRGGCFVGLTWADATFGPRRRLAALQDCEDEELRLVVADLPLSFGVAEPASLPVALWDHAVALLIQVLRIDGVAAAHRSGGGGSSVVVPRPRGGEARVRRGGVRDDDSSDGHGEEDDDSGTSGD